MLILSVEPAVILHSDGHAVRCIYRYGTGAEPPEPGQLSSTHRRDAFAHISNYWDRHPDWPYLQAGIISLDELADDLDANGKFDAGAGAGRMFIHGQVKRQAMAIESFVMRAALASGALQHNDGTFELMACDFGMDEEGRLWLHEFNVSPSLLASPPPTPVSPAGSVKTRMVTDALRLVQKTASLQREKKKGALVEHLSIVQGLRPLLGEMPDWQLLFADGTNNSNSSGCNERRSTGNGHIDRRSRKAGSCDGGGYDAVRALATAASQLGLGL